jgi:hypothetical protein
VDELASESSHFDAELSTIFFILNEVHDAFFLSKLTSLRMLADGSGLFIFVGADSTLTSKSVSYLRLIRSRSQRRVVLLFKLIYFILEMQQMLLI